MVRVLLLGDLHLSTTGPPVPPACPDLESLDVDAIISIGDIIDDNADHAGDTETGVAYEKRGRDFFERLNEVGVPVFAVPGNHDPLECTERLTDGLENVRVMHRCGIDGQSQSIAPGELEELRLVGWGCEQFDLTPAFKYDQYPAIVPDPANVESSEQMAAQSAATVESVISRFLDGTLDSQEAANEFGVSKEKQDTCATELETLASEFDAIRGLLTEETMTTVLLSHESPFNVAFDYHHSSDRVQGQLHRGSIPLKMAAVAGGPDIILSGHMHTEGRDAIETTAGYADLYNPGSPGVAFVEIEPEAGSIQLIE
ncbi:hypothetical protein GCM10009647_052240 [Streptomyces sanglieri]